MSQIIEQDKITARQLNETEMTHLPDREFNVMVIKIFTGLESGGPQ